MTRSFPRCSTFLALLAVLLCCGIALAQSSTSQDSQEQDQSTTFKVSVDVVQLFFNVKDKHNGLIGGLKKEDFQLFEDGKPQTLKYFTAESDLPLTLGIMIDTSGSQTRVLGMEKEVGASFLKQILREKDLAFVINFDISVELAQDLTNSVQRLRKALDETRINIGRPNGPGGLGGGTIPTQGPPKGTLLYDAVYLASHDMLSHEVGRKALILLTDGQDQGSRYRVHDAIEAAQKADTICYVLLVEDRGFYGGGGYFGEGDMKKMTAETGGRVIDVGNRPEKLRQAFDEISNELRSQYSIGYTPTNVARDGGFRHIEIKTKDGYKIQSRNGYYAVSR